MLLCTAGCKKPENIALQGYIEGRYTYLAPQVDGQITKILVHRGSQVKKGDIVAILDSRPEEYQWKSALNEVSYAQALLENLLSGNRQEQIDVLLAQRTQILSELNCATRELERLKALFKKGYAAQADLDQAVSKFNELVGKRAEIDSSIAVSRLAARSDQIKAAREKVAQSRQNLAQTSWLLEQKTVRSPVDGLVFDIFYEEGELLNVGSPLLTILKSGNSKAIFFLPEIYLPEIKIGDDLLISSDGTKREYKERVDFISPIAEYTPPVIYTKKQRVKMAFKVEAAISPKDEDVFHPGLPIVVNIRFQRKTG